MTIIEKLHRLQEFELSRNNGPEIFAEIKYKTKFFFCLRKTSRKDSSRYKPFAESGNPTNQTVRFRFDNEDSVKADVRFENFRREVVDLEFWVEPGLFYDAVIPQNIDKLWGPIPLDSLPAGVDNICRAVTHRYKPIYFPPPGGVGKVYHF